MILLRAFKPVDQPDVVSYWYMTTAPTARAKLDALMVHLRTQKREGWIRPAYDVLRNGVGEVRFKAQKINHRGLGYFGPDRNQFTFLLFATKTNVFKPNNAISRAVEIMKMIEADRALSIVISGRWNQP